MRGRMSADGNLIQDCRCFVLRRARSMPRPSRSAVFSLDTRAPAARARVLVAAIEILLAAKDLENARAAAGELTEIANSIGASLLHAASAHATGALLLAQGDIAGASTSLRQACEIWRDLEMPYEEAQTCLLVAAVCEKRGDEDGRRLELETARRLFKQLAAEPCLARIAEQSERATRVSQSARSANARRRSFVCLRPARRIAPSPTSSSSAKRLLPGT